MSGLYANTNDLAASTPLPRAGKESTLVDRMAQRVLLQLLGRLRYGRLILHYQGKTRVVGVEGGLSAEITVRHPHFFRRVLFGGSVGAGEAYVDGLWDVDDLTALVRIMVLNMELLERIEKRFGALFNLARVAGHLGRANTRSGARRNILSHYDLGNEMYRLFLDPTMMYSAAIYPEKTSSLEEASLNKLKVICDTLQLKRDDRVVEIGSGWGGFAIYAAANYGCHVTTTTISEAQHEEAARRIAAAGLEDRITLLKSDYRDLTGTFDKLVSIEMIEAVGKQYLPTFFETCRSLLRPDGVMLLQAITIRDDRYRQYGNAVDFIQRHIFPGGHVPSLTAMVDLLAAKTDFTVRGVYDFGEHYARTLADWRRRFHHAQGDLRRLGYDERFRRLWEFYLCYCEGGFRERYISVVHLLATRSGHRPAWQP